MRSMSQSLSTPPGDAEMLAYRTEIGTVRRFVAARARAAGLSARRVADLVIAVSELAANTLAHTRGAGTLTVWTTAEEIICEVRDTGDLTTKHPGQTRPEPDQPGGGRGLWVVRQVCDLVEISTDAPGALIRVHMQRHIPGPQAAGAR